jgi:hypothetical protein
VAIFKQIFSFVVKYGTHNFAKILERELARGCLLVVEWLGEARDVYHVEQKVLHDGLNLVLVACIGSGR